MEKETQKELLAAAKKALAMISFARLDSNFVFEFRDLIRKCESEEKNNE